MIAIDQSELGALLRRASVGRARMLVALAGPPAAGKSTLAEALAAAVPRAQVIPMDGFHLDNATLSARGLLARKGAPETFDVAGFSTCLEALAKGQLAGFPTFDRTQDAVVPDGGRVAPDATVFLVEGNYLLLDEPPWRDLDRFWDMTIRLDVAEEELERRLIARWTRHGHSPEAARARASGNDMENARRMLRGSRPADYVIA